MGFSERKKKILLILLVPKERVSCCGAILLRYKRSGMICYLVDEKWIPLSVKLASIRQDVSSGVFLSLGFFPWLILKGVKRWRFFMSSP